MKHKEYKRLRDGAREEARHIVANMTPDQQHAYEVQLARFMWAGFYRCPTTGTIREALKGDDKVLCNCGTSNPRVPAEDTPRTGCHLIRFLESATAEEYVKERKPLSLKAYYDVVKK